MTKPVQNDQQSWESVCQRCGRCCYEKVDFEGRIYYTKLPCEFLDLSTNTCRIYTERDVKRPGCIRLSPETVTKGFLPADCPYVADVENYQAPSLSDEDLPDDS